MKKTLSLLALLCAAPISAVAQRAPTYEVYAIRYASIPFKVSNLISGADPSRSIDIAMMVWLLKGSNGRVVLMDAGFFRPNFMTQWKPVNYVRPDSALAPLGVKPEDVTDVIISHIHWDHFDGASLFPKANIWIQRDEVEHYIDSTGKVLAGALSRQDAPMLHELQQAGRVKLANGDDQEIIPGIRVYTGGKHTFQSQFAGVKTTEGTVVLASDNVYLYENIDTHRPIAQTATPADTVSNLRAQDRMKTIASDARLIVPGHDPAVFTKFKEILPGIVRIR